MDCRAVSEPKLFYDTVRIILYFLQGNIEAGSVTAGQSRDSKVLQTGMEQICYCSPELALLQTLPSVVIFMHIISISLM